MFTEFTFGLVTKLNRVAYLASMASAMFTIAASSNGYAIDPNCVAKVDWTMLPSTFTHDVMGNRVNQYAQGIQPVSNERADFERSGFRHSRSTLQAGNSSDNFHVVERWGPPVQPYGEWRYPFRPFAVPYGAWGPQSPLVNAPQNNSWNFGNPGFHPGHPGHQGNGNMGVPPSGPAGMQGMGGFPGGGWVPPGGGGPSGQWPGNSWPGHAWPQGNNNFGFGVGPSNALRPDQDDYYAPAPEPPPVSDRDFFFVPRRP
jgi:hypothetical protein